MTMLTRPPGVGECPSPVGGPPSRCGTTRSPLLTGLQVLDRGRLGVMLFVHATPHRDDEMVLVDSALDRWSEVLCGERLRTRGRSRFPANPFDSLQRVRSDRWDDAL
ncbi:hypothetical protein [Nonomuraea sp. NPDC049695]|uniref:hypothetical protein n=1 Tax=Nonomuraea sp. NPDC049695 TaxID=3154734 RepID=UPI0034477C58